MNQSKATSASKATPRVSRADQIESARVAVRMVENLPAPALGEPTLDVTLRRIPPPGDNRQDLEQFLLTFSLPHPFVPGCREYVVLRHVITTRHWGAPIQCVETAVLRERKHDVDPAREPIAQIFGARRWHATRAEAVAAVRAQIEAQIEARTADGLTDAAVLASLLAKGVL